MEHSVRSALPAVFSPAKQPSAPFAPSHGSAAGSQKPTVAGEPFAERHARVDHHDAAGEKSPFRHLVFDPGSLDRSRLRPRHKHKHSKSRDARLPRIMNPMSSSSAAKGLLPAWPGGREKESDVDDGLLRPITRESTRSGWGPEYPAGFGVGARKGSLFDDIDQNSKLGPVRGREIRSPEDLELINERRTHGEKFLRSALSLIGTLATDITRRLDYTYYNLLEKIAALTSTIASFQELFESTSALFDDFEKETTSLGQEIRKQILEFKEFRPQVQKIEALEQRMKAGRTRADALNERLEVMRAKIDCWEKREVECQRRINRSLRVFWIVVTTGCVAVFMALIAQSWRMESSGLGSLDQTAIPALNSSRPLLQGQEEGPSWSLYPSGLSDRYSNIQDRQSPRPASTPASTILDVGAQPTDRDPLKSLEEL
ncbi:hypothetical protein P170DRAFT_457015 [Aspergillus steynii IBT 23096]|uniref:Uncharacterized protein n=1 Tax=Aspergillus steynii IBT 23096 TaxID=1392250 RepID=A0A2I2G6R3_9EURO|nr:uncharacterized protein P170DRAFT_457015 [Aspergillus steynii IBT 23096]PLB48567.1 hypothetical protein P170DRAFT_457015 [Aspergillus steynii IBT 23096]